MLVPGVKTVLSDNDDNDDDDDDDIVERLPVLFDETFSVLFESIEPKESEDVADEILDE